MARDRILSQFDAIPAGDPKTMYLVVGVTGDQFSHEELSAAAGGACCQTTASTMICVRSCVSSHSTASTQCR
jgi:hypothetical protein